MMYYHTIYVIGLIHLYIKGRILFIKRKCGDTKLKDITNDKVSRDLDSTIFI